MAVITWARGSIWRLVVFISMMVPFAGILASQIRSNRPAEVCAKDQVGDGLARQDADGLGAWSSSITINAGTVLGPISPYLCGNNTQWVENGDGVYEGAQQIRDRGFSDADSDGKNELVLATGRGIRTQPGTSHVLVVKKL